MRMPNRAAMSRRDLLSLIRNSCRQRGGVSSDDEPRSRLRLRIQGPIELEGDPNGATVLVLGAGLAGLTAAYELGKVGYKVTVIEFNHRPGGRNWTIRGGDTYTELGGASQTYRFDGDLYFNPGPWQNPLPPSRLAHYCRRLGVPLEPFVQLNHNAYLHSSKGFGGKPRRIREIKADFQGGVSELLAKTTQQGRLDEAVSAEDKQILLEALSLGRPRRQPFVSRKSELKRHSAATRSLPAAASMQRPGPARQSNYRRS